MSPLRSDRSLASLPPLRIVRPAGPPIGIRLHRSFLTRGLLVLAALALPALGIRLADTTVQPSDAGASQVAAVLSPPPAKAAAASGVEQSR